MSKTIDQQCHEWAALAEVYATEYDTRHDWTQRQIRICANRIIALRAAEQAQADAQQVTL